MNTESDDHQGVLLLIIPPLLGIGGLALATSISALITVILLRKKKKKKLPSFYISMHQVMQIGAGIIK